MSKKLFQVFDSEFSATVPAFTVEVADMEAAQERYIMVCEAQDMVFGTLRVVELDVEWKTLLMIER